MKSIANYISISRIFLSHIMILVKPLGIAFFIIYISCEISDVLDGYIVK